MSVVIGVDGSGRTHRLDQIAGTWAGPVIRIDASTADGGEIAAAVRRATTDDALIVVDDAHRLEAAALRELSSAARAGVTMSISRRPTLDRRELAELDEAVTAQNGRVDLLRPLSLQQVAALVTAAAGRPLGTDVVAAVAQASGGWAALAAGIASGLGEAREPTGPPAPGDGGLGQVADRPPARLVARIHRRLALLPPQATRLARVLALRLDLPDGLLADASGLSVDDLGPAMRHLRDDGMLVDDSDADENRDAVRTEQMVPAVAAAVLAEMAPAERRRVHSSVAAVLLASGTEPVAAAVQLRAARARTPEAASLFRTAADSVRFSDPSAALTWYAEALEAGADPETVTAGRAEAAALLGQPMLAGWDTPEPRAESTRLAAVEGAVLAHQGRADRSARTLIEAGPPWSALSVPALVALGRPDEAEACLDRGRFPGALRLLAEAALAMRDPVAAVPLFIEAAEAFDGAPAAMVLPDTPHAIGAMVAVTAGDTPTAEDLLQQAIASGVGGPVAADRHHLLLAWARMRTARYETAVSEVQRLQASRLSGRDRLLFAALQAGLARRSGDIAQARAMWTMADQAMARQSVDLLMVEPLEELTVAAARLRKHHRIAPIVDRLEDIVDRLGRPPAWFVALSWLQLQIAVVDDDATRAADIAKQVSHVTATGGRQEALCVAVPCWADVLTGSVDADDVVRVTDTLAAAGLPWEASRLAGQASIRIREPGRARSLLERARDLSLAESGARQPDGSTAVLSEREAEVARLILAGRTHRDIGSQLFISPKTVEHHVSRMRTKLDASSKAEFVAALRRVLGETADG